jgi:hypothetical protein
MALRLDSGRRLDPAGPAAMLPPYPSSALTRAAAMLAMQRLTPAMYHHSHRTFLFGAALGEVEGLDVDLELLLAAALLHDVGLPSREPDGDFTRGSSRVARDVAEQVGLSTAATRTMRDAITLHHTPGVTRDDGPVAYLLHAGAAADVVGSRVGQLPPEVVTDVLALHPRAGFAREFAAAFRTEARRAPRGRAALLRRYGAFDLAIRTAPFRG